MKKPNKEHQNLVLAKLIGITEIPVTHQSLVLTRLEKIKENPERLLNWDEVSNSLTHDEQLNGFDAKKFNGKLRGN
ncbi:hypothetical protein KXD93_16485 [Mucilaginibacter sp. BJC16-A38]|uniref:hypothetical protein n=1 Tax=Mucilaginibacter phenanthrenivorans TaxID=1234842 RepID=UPI0021580E6F|nr:hypothetical protein [Mucilaginibacter phenanthrenivorans]MCR8559257.1 hypothetical protein [Mucilaginibacter phenanthrenivorans]